MVCAFGIGPEGTAWFSPKGGISRVGLLGHTSSDDVLAAPSAGNVSALVRQRGCGRGTSSVATGFDGEEHHKPEADAPKEGEHKEEEGEHKEKGGMGCFPGRASVYVKGRGSIRVDAVCPGDMLLCGDAHAGRLFFSPFLGHLHLEELPHADYVSLKVGSAGATLLTTSEHLVFAASSGSTSALSCARRAGDLCEGDWLSRVSCDGCLSRVQISAISHTAEEGLYAPLTQCGTVVVEGFLCSCYADVLPASMPYWLRYFTASHEGLHGALFPWRVACSLGANKGEAVSKVFHGIHPYCRALMKLPVVARALA